MARIRKETTISSRIVGERLGAKMAISKWPATAIITAPSPLGQYIQNFKMSNREGLFEKSG